MELKAVKSKRKAYSRRGMILFLIFAVLIPAIGSSGIWLIHDEIVTGQFWAILFGSCLISLIPSLCVFGGFWGACYGRAIAQNLVLTEDELVYSIYTGSLDERETNIFHVKKITEYTVTDRNIFIKGNFKKKNYTMRFGSSDGRGRRIKIARVFENEDKLIEFLDSHLESTMPDKGELAGAGEGYHASYTFMNELAGDFEPDWVNEMEGLPETEIEAKRKFSLYADLSFLTKIDFKNEELTISYLNTNRNMALPFRSREYRFSVKDIAEARFYPGLHVLAITGKPLVTTTYELAGPEEKDYRDTPEAVTVALYITGEIRKGTLNLMKKICTGGQFIEDGATGEASAV